jgi:hypothetical protein
MSGAEGIVLLNKRANDPTEPQAVRARAVFALFAQYVRPGSSVDEVRRVITDNDWLREAHLEGVRVMGGKVPVEYPLEDTVFCLHLFPLDAEKKQSPWVMYFRLSGKLRDQDGLAFLRGEKSAGNPKLMEFALCFPASIESSDHVGRIENFSAKGTSVLEEH